MDKKKLSIRIVFLIVFIFLINFAAGKFHWYSSMWWFDMFMHFLGGFWLGLITIYFLPPRQSSLNSIFKIILSVLIFAIAWEFFEFFVDANISKNVFNILDTFSDICFGLAGGFGAMLYFFKRIMFPSPNTLAGK